MKSVKVHIYRSAGMIAAERVVSAVRGLLRRGAAVNKFVDRCFVSISPHHNGREQGLALSTYVHGDRSKGGKLPARHITVYVYEHRVSDQIMVTTSERFGGEWDCVTDAEYRASIAFSNGDYVGAARCVVEQLRPVLRGVFRDCDYGEV